MDIKIRIIRSRAPRLLYGAIFAVSPALINYQPARIQMKTGFGKGEDDIGLLANAYKNQPAPFAKPLRRRFPPLARLFCSFLGAPSERRLPAKSAQARFGLLSAFWLNFFKERLSPVQPGHSQNRSKGAFRRWHGYFAHFLALPQNAGRLPNPRKHDLPFHPRSG